MHEKLQDGKSSSLTAPHGPSQQAVIAAALSEANLSASDLAGLEMHGTGTPLGDPIEIGAATTVLQVDARPLHLSAAKSILGHAEPAAGSVGIAHALFTMSQAHTSLFPHVRSANPHILSLLEASGKASSIRVPRQPGPQVSGMGGQALGVSAFAFQGTNAHVILQQADPSNRATPLQLAWNRQRFWYKVDSKATLLRAGVSQGKAVFQTRLNRATLAFFIDHQVQGQALFPGAGMFDMACSAARASFADPVPASGFALLAASIAAPLPVHTAEQQDLLCALDFQQGTVDVQSYSARKMHQTHLRASFSELYGPCSFCCRLFLSVL